MSRNYQAEVFEFIRTRTSTEPNMNTILFKDTGIDGLDAQVFMNDFFLKFDVDSSAYNYEKYSFNEANLLNVYKAFFNFILCRNNVKPNTFSVNHLIKVAIRKEWFDECI